jgi:hypothetical protein
VAPGHVPSYFQHFISFWTVSYFNPALEGKVKSWINLHYQVRPSLTCRLLLIVDLLVTATAGCCRVCGAAGVGWCRTAADAHERRH